MSVPAWQVINWTPVKLELPDFQRTFSSFKHLGTTIHADAEQSDLRSGQAVWGMEHDGRWIGVAFEWAEMTNHIVALSDPMQVIQKRSSDSVPDRYARAVAYYRIPDIPKSLALVDGLIADYPQDPYFHELKGQILFENGRVQEAVQPYRDALHYRPDSALIRYGLARALLESERQQDLTEAAALLREVVRIEPQNGGAWRFLGIAEGRLGNEGLASLALAEQAVLAGNRKDADLYLHRAEQSIQPGDPDWIRLQDLTRAAADIEPPPPRRR